MGWPTPFLEVAILDRSRTLPRKFRRIKGDWLTQLLTDGTVPPDPGPEAPPAVAPAEVRETELGQPEG